MQYPDFKVFKGQPGILGGPRGGILSRDGPVPWERVHRMEWGTALTHLRAPESFPISAYSPKLSPGVGKERGWGCERRSPNPEKAGQGLLAMRGDHQEV